MASPKFFLYAFIVILAVITQSSFAKGNGPKGPKPNDYECPEPTEYLSEHVICSLLHQESQQPHHALANATIHINTGTNPPKWLHVADISGKVQQSYDNFFGTMKGQFWINIGGVFYSVAEYMYTMLKDNNGQYNNFCIRFSNESGVHEYYEGTPSKVGNTMVGGNYIKTKAMDPVNAGDITRAEWFVGKNGNVSNCITDFGADGTTPTVQVCLFFQNVDAADFPVSAPSTTSFAKRSEGKMLRIGKFNLPDYAFSTQALSQFETYCPSIISDF